jgi:hypothetical protein
VVEDRIGSLVHEGRGLLDTGHRGEALFTFLRSLVLDWGATDRGLADALAGLGIDIKATMPEAKGAFHDLVDSILIGLQAMQASNPGAAERATEVVLDGLRWR